MAFAAALALALLVLRLAVSGQFTLYFDEAYYWVWSEHLAAGYYDHPPMVAVFIWLGTALFGDTEFGVRFVGTVSAAVDTLLIYLIMRTLFDNVRLAAWAAIISSCGTMTAFSLFIVPDTPMMLFWLASFYALAKIARGGSDWWWLVVGAMIGLTAASKFTAIFLAIAIPIWLLVVPEMRRSFFRPWIYAGAAVSVLVFLPVLLWNAENDWIAFTLQLGRERFDAPSIGSFFQYLSLFPLMMGPLIMVLSVIGPMTWKRPWLTDPAKALLVLAAAPTVIYFAIHSFGEWIGAHWISPALAVGAMLAAFAVESDRGRLIGRIARKLFIPIGIGTTLLFYFMVLERVLPIPISYDLTARFRGWDDYAANIEAARLEAGADYIVAPDYALYSLLRFYSDSSAPIVPLGDAPRWETFPDLPLLGEEMMFRSGLYVGKWSQDQAREVLPEFYHQFELVARLERPVRPGEVEVKWGFLVRDPKQPAMRLYR